MPKTYCLYVDDSGSRHPDRQPGTHFGGWFGLGGLLVREDEEAAARMLVSEFRARWPKVGQSPLHSYDIRNSTKGFSWLTQISASERARFMADLSQTITGLPIHALACVVDRDGYNRRYLDQYGADRWKLCKTAFSILLERAVKFAQHFDAKLRVYVERSDKRTDAQMKGYYDELKVRGLPFDGQRSAQYSPLGADDFKSVLYEFRLKDKQSELMQVADLLLWPLCRNGYALEEKSYNALKESGRLVEHLCSSSNKLQGTKYSCFEAVVKK